jgi:osmotically-inducible protein OsmY
LLYKSQGMTKGDKKMKTDMGLKSDVQDELRWEPSVNASEIGVIVKTGVITLTGSVDRYPEKWEAKREDAGRAAWSAPGVTEVENKIMIS